MPNFINQFGDVSHTYISGDTFVRTNNDQVIFGEKTFISDVYISGDLIVSGETRTQSIVDLDVTGDISGYIFRGRTGYFDTIVTNGLQAPGGGSVAGGGGIDGGPIFVENATASVGTINIESRDDQNFIEEISTAENFFNAHLMLERGDSQLFRPTGILYYQTGKPLESPNEDSPVYVDPMTLSLDSNGYSWNKTVNLPVNDTLIDASKRVYYVFKNGDRSTEMRAKLETAPEVTAAEFIQQDNTSIYPAYTASFTDQSGVQHSANAGAGQITHQTKVKSGDTVKVKVIADKDFVQIQLGGGLSGTINVGATTSHEFTRTISLSNASDQDKSFTVKVKDNKGNWSDVKTSTDFSPGTSGGSATIASNNYSPTMSISSPNYDNGNPAIQQGAQTDPFTYTLTYSGPAEVYWKVEFLSFVGTDGYTGEAVLWDWNVPSGTNDNSGITPTTSQPSSGSVQFMDGSQVMSEEEASKQPFRVKLFYKPTGKESSWINAPSVFLQQLYKVPTLTISTKTVRVGDDSGNQESISITSSSTLGSSGIEEENGVPAEDSSGNTSFVSLGVQAIVVYNGASYGPLLTYPTYKITKLSGEEMGAIPIQQGQITIKGFTLKTLTVDGGASAGNARHSDGILIQGATDSYPTIVGHPSKIKSSLGAVGSVTVKIGTGGEGNYPYSSAITSTNIENASTAAEVGLNGNKDHIFFDYHLLGMIPDPNVAVIVKLEEVI